MNLRSSQALLNLNSIEYIPANVMCMFNFLLRCLVTLVRFWEIWIILILLTMLWTHSRLHYYSTWPQQQRMEIDNWETIKKSMKIFCFTHSWIQRQSYSLFTNGNAHVLVFLSRPFSVFPHPWPFSLSAGNVILGRPDFHYLCFLSAKLQLIPLRISNLLIQA